ncbi:lipopolysaccharide biosynthesis protein [Marisediminicola sp. LYQ134]|uniref:lipopolysaccharide biosynthesis protein n=1 Tax=Marisediminicola sp. LYQ134 TaxID=3391061 RepID=UPI0039831A0F
MVLWRGLPGESFDAAFSEDRVVVQRGRRLAGQFAWASGGRIVAALLQAGLLVLAARAVVPAEFGLLASVLGIATVVQTGLDFGVSTFITRERATNPESGSIRTALRFNTLTSALMAVISALVLALVGWLVDPRFLLLLPLAVWISMERTADVRLAIAFADGDVKVNSINLIARRSVAIILFVALAPVIDAMLAFAISTAVAAVGSAVFANAYVRRRVTVPASIRYSELLKASWPYWLHSLATQARNLDAAVTAGFAGPTQAGYFSVASRLTSPLRILPTTLGNVLLPNASRLSGSRRDMRSLAKLSVVALLISTALYAVVFLLTPWGVPLLLGADYANSVPAVMIVVAGLPFAAAISLFSALLQGAGRKHFVATVSTSSAIICLTAVAIASAAWGAIGAAGALSMTFMLQAVATVIGYYFFVDRNRQENP